MKINRYWLSEPVRHGWWQTLAALFLLSLPLARGAALVQEFYLPMPESQIYQANSAIISGTGSTMASTFSIVVTGSGTVVYYDQWEDGYETDLSHPTQATTQIWGDGNDAHGIPPGFAHNPVGLPAGTVITLTNNVTLPRNPSTILWDARDRVAATKALIISRAAWPIPTGPVFAGAASVLSTLDYGTNYISPVGQDLAPNLFKYVGMFIMAAQNNTAVTIDPNGNGSSLTSIVLNQGESYLINGGIKKGGRVTASKPVQADLIIGHVGSAYASDWFTLYPASAWSSSYYTPVGSAAKVSQPAYVYLYNSSTNAITINYATKVGSGSFSVPGTNGVYQFQMPVSSGASFVSAGGENFYALCTVAANNSSDTAYNWGFTLVPQSALTTEATVGWGPGSDNGTVNGSPVWATALAGTTLYVDYQGDHAGPFTDVNGNHYDTNFTVSALQSQKIFDPSKNQTGMRVYTVDGTLLTAAWGEDPDVAAAGNPYIDAGTTVLPFPTPLVKKSALIVTDAPPANLSVGDTIQYTVQVDNKGLLPLGNTVVIDAPSGNLTYVPHSTTFDGNSIPDNLSGTNFPLSAPGYTIPVILARGTSTFTYLAQVNAGGTVSNSVNIGGTTISAQTSIPPAPASGAAVYLHFSDVAGTTLGAYALGANVYVTMTNAVGNTASNSVQTIAVTVVDTNTLDLQTITLTETGTNTGVFRNVSGLPTSATAGLGAQDGTLNVAPGDTLSVSYTDPVYGDSAAATALISFPTPSKQLYLSVNDSTNGTQVLNRVDPVANAHGPIHTSLDIGNGGGGAIAVDAVSTNTTGNSSMANTLTIAHTTGNGANRLMLVTVGIGASADTSSLQTNCRSVTYNNINLTRVGAVIDGYSTPTVGSEIWQLVNPPSGTYNVVITLTNSQTRPIVGGVMTLTGVNQTTPLGTYASVRCANSTSPTDQPNVTNSTAAGEMVFASAVIDGDGSGTPPPALTIGAGQTSYLDQTALYRVRCVASLKPGSASTPFTNSWRWASSQQWAIGAVAIKPAGGGGGGPATNVTAFAQTPALAAPFTLPAGGTVAITNFITLTNGTLSTGAAVTATVQTNGVDFLTLNNPVYNTAGGVTNLAWNGTLPASVTIPAGAVIRYVISNGVANSAFHVNYDSTNAQSVIVLPASASTVIQLNSLGVYDAPYPGGSLVTTPVAGSTVYIRASASDPFGSYDITSLGLAVTGPDAASSFTNVLTDTSVVASNSLSKTYEYVWITGSTAGGYGLAVTANEGTEGVTATAAASITTTFLDLGTPSTTVFTAGANGPVTNSYGGGGAVSVRVSDLNRNTNATALDTVTVTVTSSTGDSETLLLVETGVDTGVFTNSLNASTSIVGTANNGTLYAPVGSILTASYTDPTDAGDTSSATATVQPAPGIPGIAMNKTILSPAGGQTGVGQPVTYNLQVVNTGSTTLPSLKITDAFPAGNLSYTEASVTPSTIAAGSLTWNNLGSLTPGQSTNLTVTFTTLATGQVTNSATANGSTATNSSAVTLLVNNAAVNVTKILLDPTNQPVSVGSNVTFRITIQNVGNTVINYLPLEDTFSGAYYQYVSSTITNNGSGAGVLIWTNLAYPVALATNAILTNDVTMLVVGEGSPANNSAAVDFATDIFGNSVPAAVSTIGVDTAAASISGHVYNDINHSGVFTNGDVGLGAVTLRLFTDPNGDGDPSDGVLVQVTTTDVNGYYELLNLSLGRYVVVATPLPGYVCNAPANGRLPLELTTLTASTNNFFFQYLPDPSAYSTVGGSVWYDTNGNGTNDLGETNLANVEIDLVADANTNGLVDVGETVAVSTETDANGHYSFAGVTPGNYVIQEINLYGYYNSGAGAGTNFDQIPFRSTTGVVSTNNDFYNRPPPVAVNDTNSAYESAPTIFQPLMNDLSPNGDLLFITNVSSADGVVIINPGSTNLTFTPGHSGVGTINYTISDGHGGTSSAVISVTVTTLADLAIGKSAAGSVLATSNLTYSISVTNFGPSTASGVLVTDALPATVAYVGSTGGGAVNSGVVTWDLGALTNGQVLTVTVTVTAPASGTLTNAASVGSPTPDANPTNNLTPPVTTTVTASADVAIGKSGPASGVYGAAYDYTICVTNFGPSTATALVVTDSLPAGLAFVSSIPAATTNASNQVIWSSLGNLAAGQTTNLTLTVNATGSGTVSNTASVGSPTFDPEATNNVTTPVVTVISPALPLIGWPTPTNIIYGTPLSLLQNNATSSVPGTAVYTPTNGTILPAGTNVLTVVMTPEDTNYAATNLSVLLVVDPAPLSVTASNAARVYGQPNPVFGGTITGIQNTDDITATFATAATAGSPVGGYPIVPTLSDPNSRLANYAVTTNNGTLTIAPATLGITANSTNRLYDMANPTFTYTPSGFVNGDNAGVLSGSPSLTTTANSSSPAGTYPIAATNGTLTATNYVFSFTNGTLTVLGGTYGITWTNPASIVYGTVLGTNQNNASATVAGTYAYDPTNGTLLPAGTNLLNVAFTPDDTNYAATNLSVALIVMPAPLSITANSTNKVYNTALNLDTNAFTSNGLVNSETIGGVTLASAGTAANAIVGTYPITASDATGGTFNPANYSITYSNGVLTVLPGGYTANWPTPTNIVYGTALDTNQNDAATTIPGTFTYDPTNGTVLTVGTNWLTVDFTPTDTNYVATNLSVQLIVLPAALTITASDQTKFYGQTLTLGAGQTNFSSSGLVNGDSLSSVTLNSAGADSGAALGNYPIVPSAAVGGGLTNYDIGYSNGTLTVSASGYTAMWPTPASIVYGTPLSALQNNATSSVPGTAVYDPTNGTVLPAGTNALTVIYTPDDTNYAGTNLSVLLVVTPAPLSVTASNASRSYGQPNPTFGGTIAGIQNSDDISAAYATSATTNSPAGDYLIVPTLSDPNSRLVNYVVTTNNGILTVSQAVLAIVADNTNRIYGAANPVFTYTPSGFVNGETADVLSGVPSLTTLATTNSGVGPYAIAVTNGTLSATNYSFNFVNGTLTIGKATLTVAANDTNRVYGATNPTFTYTPSGFVNGEAAGVLSGSPSLTTTATTASGVGTYPLAATNGTLSAANYTFSFVDGTLTISQASLTLTASNQAKPYGTSLTLGAGQASFSSSGLVNGDDVTSVTLASPGAASGAAVGTYPIVPSAAVGGGLTNYNIGYSNGVLTVNQTSPEVGWPVPTNIVYGTPLSALQNNATSSVPGTAVYGPTNGTILPAGTNVLTVVMTPTDTNYAATNLSVLLVVDPAPLTVTANPASKAFGATLAFAGTEFTTGPLVAGDTVTSVTLTSAGAIHMAVPGIYPIIPTNAVGAGLANYSITYSNGVLTVTNMPPTANPQSVAVIQNTPKGIVLTGSDPNLLPLTFANISDPAHGVLSLIDTNAGSLTYTPDNNYLGGDSFTFRVNNGQTSSAPATVTISVAPATNADVQVSLAGPALVTVGDVFVFTTVVTNAGPATATTLRATNILPSNLTFASASGGGIYSNGVVTWPTVGTLSNGLITNLTVSVKTAASSSTVSPTANPFTFIVTNNPPVIKSATNRASAFAATYDPNLTNNLASLAYTNAQAQTLIVPGVFSVSLATNTYPTNAVSTNTVIPVGTGLFIAGTSAFNPQTQLYEEFVAVTNIGQAPVHALRLSIGNLRSGVMLYNATGTNAGVPYVEYDPPYESPLNPGGWVTFTLEFFVADRRPFTNSLSVVAIQAPATAATNGTPVTILQSGFADLRNLSNPRFLVEFTSIPGRTYTVLYSDDMVTWHIATPSIVASTTATFWYDDGPPGTLSKPIYGSAHRFYRVLLNP